jgi:hypothetical protein
MVSRPQTLPAAAISRAADALTPRVCPSPVPLALAVGNLPWSVDDLQLRQAFEHIGAIAEVKVGVLWSGLSASSLWPRAMRALPKCRGRVCLRPTATD